MYQVITRRGANWRKVFETGSQTVARIIALQERDKGELVKLLCGGRCVMNFC
jgi:hypothetical protein